METDALTILRNENNISFIIRNLNFDQFIILTECDRSKSCLSYICVIQDRRLLNKTFLGCHEQIVTFLEILDWNHCCDLLIRLKLKDVDNCCTSGSSSCFRNLISLQAIAASGIGKEHNILVSIGHKQLFYIVFIQSLHTLDTLAATILALESIVAHSLNVSHLGHGDHYIFSRDQILCRNVVFIKSDGCSSVISVFFRDHKDFFLNYAKQKLSVCEDRLVLCDLLLKLCILCFQLLSFQTGQSSQTHIHDSLGLCIT